MTRTVQLLTVPIALAAVGVAVAPLFVINPAQPQDAADIRIGYLLGKWGGSITFVLLIVGIGLVLAAWQSTRSRWGKAWLVAASVLMILGVVLARTPFVERMFSPLEEVRRVTASEATYLQPADLVLGVAAAGRSMAYPVPIVAYHHIVNDRLGDEPFVVTY